MFVIEGMDKVREVIEKNRKRKLVKHKKLSNTRIIEIDNCSPLEIRKLQNNLTMIADNEGIEFVYFDTTDVVRHRLVKKIIKAYNGESPNKS